jgi:hypothetical protein
MPRYMLFIYPGEESRGRWEPTAEEIAVMMQYNEELTKAGALLALDGLHPPSEGARVSASGGERTVTDGPFAEAKEVVGGYWIIQAKSIQEAVEWASRCPLGEGDMIEVRQVYEATDFPDAADLSQAPPDQTSAG